MSKRQTSRHPGKDFPAFGTDCLLQCWSRTSCAIGNFSPRRQIGMCTCHSGNRNTPDFKFGDILTMGTCLRKGHSDMGSRIVYAPILGTIPIDRRCIINRSPVRSIGGNGERILVAIPLRDIDRRHEIGLGKIDLNVSIRANVAKTRAILQIAVKEIVDFSPSAESGSFNATSADDLLRGTLEHCDVDGFRREARQRHRGEGEREEEGMRGGRFHFGILSEGR